MADDERAADDLDETGDDELDEELDDDLEDEDDLDEDGADADEEVAARSPRTTAFWADVRVDPVEIALPGGVGYTLRAYRPASQLAVIGRTTSADLDDFDAASAAVMRRRRAEAVEEDEPELSDEELADLERQALEAAEANPDLDQDELDEINEADTDEDDADESDDDESDEDDDDEDEDAEADDEDNPVFLGQGGRVFLFHSPDKLVEFVRSGADHDMSHLDTWSDVVSRIRVEDVEPLDADRYELDLVVENLRGGPDAWDAALILKAGEIARDLGYGLRVDPVMVALAPGSPLDELDEALRAVEQGGLGTFFAKRRLRKIPAQQSSLAWRTVIGKISSAADWRD